MKDFLKTVDLFADLTEGELDRVTRALKRHTFRPGDRIIQENQAAERCYMILSGSVKVAASISGQEDLFAILNPGDHFGEISLIDGRAPSATVVAQETTHALSISHEDLKVLMENDPSIAAKILMSMMKGLCRRLRETDQTLTFTRFMMRQGRA